MSRPSATLLSALADAEPLEFLRYGRCAAMARGDTLDAGCGIAAGTAILALGPSVDSVVGLDRDPDALQIAKDLWVAARRVRLMRGEIEKVRPAKFDTVVIIDVLHLVDNVDRALAACVSALRPGGLLLCGDRPSASYRRVAGSLIDLGHRIGRLGLRWRSEFLLEPIGVGAQKARVAWILAAEI